jgi:16S rRNA (adenine1518-N6/adenine1519-N6)-dimethyltransferase
VSTGVRVRARKSLGQHWLTDRKALRKIVAAAELRPGETIVEVGPGTGLLTEVLATTDNRVVAVEVDDGLAERLRQRLSSNDRVSVLNRDVLEATPEELLAEGGGGVPYVLVGNLPYFIGTAIVRRFLDAVVRPRSLVVTLQAEVAESIAAPAGQMSYLSVEMQTRADARILFYLPPSAFKPPPKVRSAVVRLDVLDASEAEVDDRGAFLALVRAGFAAPRKRIRNSLAIGLRIAAPEAAAMLADANLDPDRRPATLGMSDWRDLYFAYRSHDRAH